MAANVHDLDAILCDPEFIRRVKRRCIPSDWTAVPEVLTAAMHALKTWGGPDPMAPKPEVTKRKAARKAGKRR